MIIVLEGDEPLGQAARDYYDHLIGELRADHQHVQGVQDFWGDELTRGAAQSADGKAAYVQISLVGSQDQDLATTNESVAAVRGIVERIQPPG